MVRGLQVVSNRKRVTPHTPHQYLEMCVCVCVCLGGGGVWLPVCTLLTNSRLRTSRFIEQRDIYHAENVTYIAHALVCENISDT